MANHLDEYYYGDFDDRGKDFPDEFHAVVDHGMWPTVEKIVEYEGIRHPRMKFVYIGSYHFRDGDQQAFARSNGHSIELYQGSRGNDIVQPIRGLGENRVYYKAPYLYVSGSQEARSRTKSRMTSRARAESMVHFVFLMKNEISSIHNKDDQDLLAEFESICVNFTHIKEEEDRKAEENSKDPKPRDYRPGGGAAGAGGAGGGGRYGSDSVKPEIPVKKKLGSGFGSSVKSEPDSDDELSFSSRNTWLSAQSSRRQTSYSYESPSSTSAYMFKTPTPRKEIKPASSWMDDWRAGKGKDNSETQPQTGSRVDPPKTPRKRTAAEYYNDRNSKNWRPNELENSPPSPSIKKEPTDKESAKIKKEQNDSDFSWLYGGTEFARAAYQVLFDADKSGKQDTSREIIELE